jgi:hypothetical protein
VDVSPFAGLSERDLPQQQFVTVEEQESEFVRLKKLPRNRDANDNDLWAQAARNISRPRTRGLERLGGHTALGEFEPGATFVPVDRSIGVGDLFGGFRSSSGRDDLTVQIGSVEDEVDVSPFAGLPERDLPRERFFAIEEQRSEFVRLKGLQSNDGVNDNVLWAQAGQNLAAARTRGLEGLGGSVATGEFEPGTAFVPIDRKVRIGDLFGGLRPESRPDLDVQIGPSEDEIDAGAPAVLPIAEAILFRRLRPLHPGMDSDDLMLRVRRLVRASRTRGIEGLPLDEVIAEFDPTADGRFIEDNGFGAALKEGLSEPAKWVANCLTGKLAEEAAVRYAATGRIVAPTPRSVALALAECAADQVAADLGIPQ